MSDPVGAPVQPPDQPAAATPAATQQPIARLRRERSWSLLWVLPLAALGVALWLGWRAWRERGPELTVLLADGHGLRAGDQVRYRGIAVGEVESLRLREDLAGAVALVRLRREAAGLARAGARFWVQRPQLSLSGVSGLDALAGSRWLGVLPGDGAPAAHFVALDHPPVADELLDGLDLVLQAPRRGGLRPGSPVTFRGMAVGAVLALGLASDGSAVELRVRIREPYGALVRSTTRFFDAGGVDLKFGWSGLDLRVDTVESLLGGAVGFATPPELGEAVQDGHRFTLHQRPEEEWLRWRPALPLADGRSGDLALPRPLVVRLGWKRDGWIKRQLTRRGLLLRLPAGVLGPTDLLAEPAAAPGTLAFELDGAYQPPPTPVWNAGGLALASAEGAQPPWPGDRLRSAARPEDLVLAGPPGSAPMPVAAARLQARDGRWRAELPLPVGDDWHGAPAVAASDGRVVGVLIVRDGTWIAPLPALPAAASPPTTP